MGLKISELNPTVFQTREHELPSMHDGGTVKLTVAQILDLIAKGDFISKFGASDVVFTPVGTISAGDVQAALAELDSEKFAKAGGTMAGPVNYANFAITNPAGKWLRGYLSPGFNLANNATDATNDIDFPAGQVASDETTPILMDHAAGTAQLDVVYGTGNGGRFSSAAISDGTWHCFVASNGSAVIRGFSKNLDPTTDSNYPAGYTHYRRVGSVIRSSGAILAFRQFGNRFMLTSSVTARSSTAAFADAVLAVTAPAGIRTRPILTNVVAASTSSVVQISLGDGDASATQIISQTTGNISAGSFNNTILVDCFYTNTSSQIRYFVTITGTALANTLNCTGWYDDRGING
ncbi:hypothetical protein AS026_21260 [Rhizobium altiplani]|uniref:Uncharacterized protein n=1 Tax=Rhizobium altiplani TaxID=1864509 RepID=A0A125Q4M9_9HYPH|nr:hypothetical protein [Rhizobium altiplani]KWV42140.1 hypothetical protein AS026_21260 [Rhizobium altiplani]